MGKTVRVVVASKTQLGTMSNLTQYPLLNSRGFLYEQRKVYLASRC